MLDSSFFLIILIYCYILFFINLFGIMLLIACFAYEMLLREINANMTSNFH